MSTIRRKQSCHENNLEEKGEKQHSSLKEYRKRERDSFEEEKERDRCKVRRDVRLMKKRETEKRRRTTYPSVHRMCLSVFLQSNLGL